jgi:Glycine-zipper domain
MLATFPRFTPVGPDLRRRACLFIISPNPPIPNSHAEYLCLGARSQPMLQAVARSSQSKSTDCRSSDQGPIATAGLDAEIDPGNVITRQPYDATERSDASIARGTTPFPPSVWSRIRASMVVASFFASGGPMRISILCLNKRLSLLAILLAGSGACFAQAPTAPVPASSMSSSLGVFVFPAKKQTAAMQTTDEATCFAWGKTQTGIDPLNIVAQTPAQTPADPNAANPAQGARVRGAVRGAAAGAAIGAIAGDTGKGAAIGAATGTMAGGRAKRQAARQGEDQQKQSEAAAVEQAGQQVAEQKATYNKAFSACMEGKGYTFK